MMELQELARPEINSLKFKLDIVSTQDRNGAGDQSEDPTRKPEVRVIMELKVEPNFFVAELNDMSAEEVISLMERATRKDAGGSTVKRSVLSPPALNDSRKEEGNGDAIVPLSHDTSQDQQGQACDVTSSDADQESDTEDQIAQMSQLSHKETTPQLHSSGSGTKQRPVTASNNGKGISDGNITCLFRYVAFRLEYNLPNSMRGKMNK